MIVVKDELCQSSPEIVANIFDLFKRKEGNLFISKHSKNTFNLIKHKNELKYFFKFIYKFNII
jgi:hypothetical protein